MSRLVWNLRYLLTDGRQRQVSRLHLSRLLADEYVENVEAFRPQEDSKVVVLKVTFKPGCNYPHDPSLRGLDKIYTSNIRADRPVPAKVRARGPSAKQTWYTRLLNPLFDEEG